MFSKAFVLKRNDCQIIADVAQGPLISLAGTFAVVLAVVEVFFDWDTWIDLNVSVLYSLPLVLAAAARNRRLLWSLAVALICMSFAVYLEQVPPGAISLREPFLIDRTLSAASLLLSACILDAWMRSLKTRDLQSQSIQSQNARLEAINNDLVAHKEEIFRQNEELTRRGSEIEVISHRKTQMLASISHDIRSSIQAITLMAEIIRRTAERSEQESEIAARALRLQANAIAVADFLSEIIDIASFDAGRITINKSVFPLSELIAQQRDRLLPVAESKRLNLVIEAGDTSLWLRTDRVKLGRIVGNLLGNAIKFTSTGSVRVGSGLTEDGTIFVRVTDTGRGIQSEDLGRIFEEFAQFDRPSERSSDGGWGLGLAISRRMAQLLGGGIDIQSEVGKGSVFTVSMPPSCAIDADNRLRDSDPVPDLVPRGDFRLL